MHFLCYSGYCVHIVHLFAVRNAMSCPGIIRTVVISVYKISKASQHNNNNNKFGIFYFCSHFGFHHIFHFFMADANAIYLSPKSYYLLLINTLRIISSSLFTTHHHSLFIFYFFLLPHTSLLMADANAMYHPSFIIYYSSTHYLFTYYFLINPFFFHLGWLMLTSFSS